MIGVSGEPGKVLGHIGKMIAGMVSARIDSTAGNRESKHQQSDIHTTQYWLRMRKFSLYFRTGLSASLFHIYS